MPVLADESGFSDSKDLAVESALDAGASLAEDSIEVKCAGNSGVRSDCLLVTLAACGTVPCVPKFPRYDIALRFAGMDGAIKLP